MTLTRRALLALLALLPLAACAEQPPPTPAPAGPRLVALSPAIAVILRDLGLADRIVGRHAYDMVLDPAVPVVGDQAGIDYEALLRVRPTHILLQWGSRDLPERLAELAPRHDWQVSNFNILSLDDLTTAARDLWRQFGPAAAPEPPILAALDRAWTPREGLFQGPVLLLASVDPPAALGPGSWHHQILEHIGGTPAIAEGSHWITLNSEGILRLAPEGIVLILPRGRDAPATPAPSPTDLAPLLGRLAELDIPAVREGRVALIDDPLAHTPSTAMVGLADELAEILRRWEHEQAR